MSGLSGKPSGWSGSAPEADRESRQIVLHADDLGLNDCVTQGILEAFSDGLLTSTSILANAPAAENALTAWKELQARLAARTLPSLAARTQLGDLLAPFDLGIHLNLTQGRPLSGKRYPTELLDAKGCFPGIGGLAFRLLHAGRSCRERIVDELRLQVEWLLDRGQTPTHLNSHQYVDTFPGIASLIPSLVERYRIPVVRVPWERGLFRSTLRHRFELRNWGLAQVKKLFAGQHRCRMRSHGISFPVGYFGTSHAGRIGLDQMRIFVASATRGLSEIGMHPGLPVPSAAQAAADGWDDPLSSLRPGELELLRSAELVELLQRQGIRLGRLSGLALPPRSVAAA